MPTAILNLCSSCNTEIVPGSVCPSCEEVTQTYPFPEGEPAFWERGFDRDRIDRLIAESRACDARCLAAVEELSVVRSRRVA